MIYPVYSYADTDAPVDFCGICSRPMKAREFFIFIHGRVFYHWMCVEGEEIKRIKQKQK